MKTNWSLFTIGIMAVLMGFGIGIATNMGRPPLEKVTVIKLEQIRTDSKQMMQARFWPRPHSNVTQKAYDPYEAEALKTIATRMQPR